MEVSSRPAVRRELLALVFVGGTAGTAARWALETGYGTAPGSWPWTTLGINLAGSFLLGALLESLAASGPDSGWRRRLRLGVGTGVLGGFTTYSTFSVESVGLLRSGQGWLALGYPVLSVTSGIGLALAGTRLTRALVRWRRQ